MPSTEADGYALAAAWAIRQWILISRGETLLSRWQRDIRRETVDAIDALILQDLEAQMQAQEQILAQVPLTPEALRDLFMAMNSRP